MAANGNATLENRDLQVTTDADSRNSWNNTDSKKRKLDKNQLLVQK